MSAIGFHSQMISCRKFELGVVGSLFKSETIARRFEPLAHTNH